MTDLFDTIRQSVIGTNHPFNTPFGSKPLVYADYTASGRGLEFVEDFIRQQVLPWYANTHTEFSYTGAQTTRLREQARETIRNAVNGNEHDKVIFCGSGATAAIDKLIGILGIRIPAQLSQTYKLTEMIPEQERPVVFVGPYEHHSNELPWRESIADVVNIPLDAEGQVDLGALEEALKRYQARPLKIGSFSAASNVTGIMTDVTAVTQLLKQHNALAFWDYAAGGPYMAINMNGPVALDAVFISPHKFVGGPGTPGVLVVKDWVMKNSVPAMVGGGTVAYVSPTEHRYIDDLEHREEGGTPAIVEAVRAGLVFRLQQSVGIGRIEQHEQETVSKVLKRLSRIPQLIVLGGDKAKRLPIFSLRFRHGERDLHHGLVTALLNDLFGVQVRGGCSCAGPYGHYLLDISTEYSRKIEHQVRDGFGALKPGWVRFNINYFIDEHELDYVLSAIEMVAEHGWRMLPYYQLNPQTGVWRFQAQEPALGVSLDDFLQPQAKPVAEHSVPDYQALLSEARQQLLHPESHWQRFEVKLPPETEAMRWFALEEAGQEGTADDSHNSKSRFSLSGLLNRIGLG